MDNSQQSANKTAGKKIGIFLGILVLIGASYGLYWTTYGSQFEDTENAYISGLQNAVTSQIAGNITYINLQDTQTVKKGMVALKLDDIDYKLALERAENELMHSVRSFKSLQFNTQQNQTLLSSKNIELNKSKSDFNRDSLAYREGIISKEQLDNTKLQYDQLNNGLQNAKISLENAQVLGVSNDIKNHPDVAKAINQYKQAYWDLQRTNITIPMDGVVAKKAVYLGQHITPNQLLFNIIDLNHEWVDANFKESQLKNITIGQEVELISDVNKKVYKGYISAIGAGSGSALSLLPAQNATGNWIKIVQRVPVRIDIDQKSLNDNGVLPIGTSINVSVKLKRTNYKPVVENQSLELTYSEDQLNKKIDKIISGEVNDRK